MDFCTNVHFKSYENIRELFGHHDAVRALSRESCAQKTKG